MVTRGKAASRESRDSVMGRSGTSEGPQTSTAYRTYTAGLPGKGVTVDKAVEVFEADKANQGLTADSRADTPASLPGSRRFASAKASISSRRSRGSFWLAIKALGPSCTLPQIPASLYRRGCEISSVSVLTPNGLTGSRRPRGSRPTNRRRYRSRKRNTSGSLKRSRIRSPATIVFCPRRRRPSGRSSN